MSQRNNEIKEQNTLNNGLFFSILEKSMQRKLFVTKNWCFPYFLEEY